MDDIKKLLGSRIRELRQKKKLSQEQLAELVNLDRRSISNIECGKTFPSASLVSISKALEVEVKALFDYAPNNMSGPQIITVIHNKLLKMNQEQLKIIFRLVEIM